MTAGQKAANGVFSIRQAAKRVRIADCFNYKTLCFKIKSKPVFFSKTP